MLTFLPYAALVFSACSLLIAAVTFWRNGKWRDSDEHRNLLTKVDAHDLAIPSIVSDIKALHETSLEHGQRLAAGEERFRNLATKADVAELKGEIGGLKGAVDDTKNLIGEVRRWIMQEGKS